jgi:hypothetical protein
VEPLIVSRNTAHPGFGPRERRRGPPWAPTTPRLNRLCRCRSRGQTSEAGRAGRRPRPNPPSLVAVVHAPGRARRVALGADHARTHPPLSPPFTRPDERSGPRWAPITPEPTLLRRRRSSGRTSEAGRAGAPITPEPTPLRRRRSSAGRSGPRWAPTSPEPTHLRRRPSRARPQLSSYPPPDSDVGTGVPCAGGFSRIICGTVTSL